VLRRMYKVQTSTFSAPPRTFFSRTFYNHTPSTRTKSRAATAPPLVCISLRCQAYPACMSTHVFASIYEQTLVYVVSNRHVYMRHAHSAVLLHCCPYLERFTALFSRLPCPASQSQSIYPKAVLARPLT
jgi:hypothetical protein